MSSKQCDTAKSNVDPKCVFSKQRTMIAEGKQPIVIKFGFNWLAMIFGPFWAAFKSFWPAAIALAVVNYGLRLLSHEFIDAGYPAVGLSIGIVQVGIAIIFGFYANILYATYLSFRGYKVAIQT